MKQPRRGRARTVREPATSVGVVLTQFLVVHCTAEVWVWATYGKFGSQVGVWSELVGLQPPFDPRPGFVVAIAMAAVSVLAFRPGRARLAAGVQAGIMGFLLAYFFPNVPNHFVAFTLGLGLCAFCDPEREVDLLEMGLRSVAALVFFGAGVQKILHASYFHGAVLGFMVAHAPNFLLPFNLFLPAEEIGRLRAAVPVGPFRLDSWSGLAVSNLTWILELALPVGLLASASRVAAAIGATALVVLIQVSAREIFFAGFMVPLLLLWVSRAVAVRSIYVVYAADAYVVLAAFGLFPQIAST